MDGSVHEGAGAELTTVPADRRAAREAARRQRARRGAAISIASTVIVLGGAHAADHAEQGLAQREGDVLLLGRVQDVVPGHPARVLARREALRRRRDRRARVLGLVVAMCRTTARRRCFPLRMLAAVYTDVLRGIPTILLVYLIGFGDPGAGAARRCRASPIVLGGIALALSYSAYVAEVYRAGIDSIHPSQRAAARALGLTTGQTMRLRRAAAGRPTGGPAAAQRLHLAAEGRRARLDPRRRWRRSASRRSSPRRTSTTRPLIAAALLYVARHDPARADRRPHAGPRAGRRGAGGPVSEPVLQLQGVSKAYGERRGAAGHRPRRWPSTRPSC